MDRLVVMAPHHKKYKKRLYHNTPDHARVFINYSLMTFKSCSASITVLLHASKLMTLEYTILHIALNSRSITCD